MVTGWNRAFYSLGTNIFAAKEDGSEPRKVLTVKGLEGFVVWLRFSPDGRLLRFTVIDTKRWLPSLWEAHPDGTHLRQLLAGYNACCGSWTSDGKYFVFQSYSDRFDDLWVMRETGDPWRKISQEPVQLPWEG